MKIKVDDKLIHKSSELDDFFVDNDILDKPVWLKGSWVGKVNNCKKRFMREWLPKLLADPNIASLPGSEEEIVALVKVRPDYKNRVQRDKEEEEERQRNLEKIITEKEEAVDALIKESEGG